MRASIILLLTWYLVNGFSVVSSNQEGSTNMNGMDAAATATDADAEGEKTVRKQVPCGWIKVKVKNDKMDLASAKVNPLPTVLDTSVTESTMSQKVAKKHGLSRLATKIDGKKYIPEGKLFLRMMDATVPAPKILLVADDNDGEYDLTLGMDFLTFNDGRIDPTEDELYVRVGEDPNVMIPFIQPRPNLSFGDL